IHLLDPALCLVPVGVGGELCVAGYGLARGYANRPELTAEKFVPDPLATEPGARIYRTGDLARRRPDGSIEYIGRVDHQVKIRGFRVELKEIEVSLAAHPAVRQAVALVLDNRLLAFVTGEIGGPEPVPTDLRDWLRGRLPAYMVPAAFVVLDAFPLSPNGKVDRRALARLAPADLTLPGGEETAAPRTPVEEIIAGVWSEILGTERVGVHDSFFDLGGHSLLATQVVSRLREAFSVEVPLRTLFEAPTVAGLAERVEESLRGGGGFATGPLRLRDGDSRPLSFAQQRLWFLDQLAPGKAVYTIPAGWTLTGDLDVAALTASVREIVRRHEALRTTFPAVDGTPVQVIAPPGAADVLVVGLADLTALPDAVRTAEADRLTTASATAPFDLTTGPLLRFSLVRDGASEHRGLLVIHHIVSDGWTMGVFQRELATLYARRIAGDPASLPPLPLQYADFAAWQSAQTGLLDEQLAWWRRQLAGAPPVLELPMDRPRPAEQSFRGAVLPMLFAPALSRHAHDLARHEGATLFMVLLAALQALLSRLTGEDDLTVGTAVAGRGRLETEGLIGLFVNSLALRGHLDGDPTVRDLIARARETALGAFAHDDLPFERLVEELRPQRSLAHSPIFQVFLMLQNTPLAPIPMPGLEASLLEARTNTAKLDLSVAFMQRGDELAGTLEYATDLFDTATVERFGQRLRTFLAAAVADPVCRLSALPLLTAGEETQLRTWNATGAVWPQASPRGLHGLIEAQAERTPGAVAVSDETASLTYAELDARANRLAHRLLRLGVRPEERVAIRAERSVELMVGLLAILKAGAAYVPVDPSYPEDRQAFL